ncbi:MAG: hypothetical protein MUC87_04155 [Bacteroidia bacterium]|jgi:hypothetical protein|nr:hypothetical protein [Bacteroidia bacterium]
MKISKPFLVVMFVLAAVLFADAELFAQGCSACKAAAETGTDSNGNNVSGGLNNAILYLMVVPYILLFLFFRKRIIAFWKELRSLWA